MFDLYKTVSISPFFNFQLNLPLIESCPSIKAFTFTSLFLLSISITSDVGYIVTLEKQVVPSANVIF